LFFLKIINSLSDLKGYFFVRPAKNPKSFRPHSFPRPLSAGGIQTQNISKEFAEILRNPFPRKMFSQNLVHCVFGVFPHFCFSRSSVLRTEARKRSGERLWIFSRIFDKIGSSGVI
jgi:hypothetical protein